MKQISRLALPLLAALAMLTSPGAQAARKAKDLLQYIPADTPYVLAYMEALPNGLQDKFEPVINDTLSAYRQILDASIDDVVAEYQANEGEEEAASMRAILDELSGLMSVDALRDAGLGKGSLFAIYGDGLLPVMRLALTDAKAFDATIARMEEAGDQEFLVGEVKGKAYRYRDFDNLRLVIATLGKDVVVTAVPVTFSDKRLAETLGVVKPRNSMARSKALRRIAKEYGFTDHFAGVIDVAKIVDGIINDANGRNVEFLQALGQGAPELSPVCKAEFMGMALIAPRLVSGYTRVSDDSIDTGMVVELRKDIADGLATLPAPVPGLGADFSGMLSFGFSLNPMALRNFYESRLDAMEEDPYECELLAQLQDGLAKGREALAQPIPPIVYSFRGFLANITDIRGGDLANDEPPEEVDGSLLFAMDNAEALVTMAAMLSPEIAAINLLPDGKARALDMPQLAAMAKEAFVALSESALSLGLGTGARKDTEAMLTAKTTDTRPLASFSMDAKRYYEFIGQAMMQAEPEEDEEPMPEEVRAALRDAVVSSEKLYERMTVDVHFTGRGVEIGSRMMLAD